MLVVGVVGTRSTGMSVPSELKASSRRFMEQLLMCRPGDPISFAMQYFYDERCSTPSVNHAIHSLTFLIRKPVEFRSAVATIYCAETAMNDSSDEGKSKASGANGGGGGSMSTSGQADKDEKMDAGSVKASSESKSVTEISVGGGAVGEASSKDGVKAISRQGSLADPVPRDENLTSLYLKRLCKIARMAVAASDGSLAIACSNDIEARNFSSSASMNVPGTETNEWIYDVIEKSMRGDPISQAVSLNFETYISFLRLYLGLWASLDWISKGAEVLIESENSNIDSYDVGESQGGNLKLSEPIIMPDDIDLLGRALKGTYYACTPEDRMNMQIIVSRSFDIFAKSVLEA